LCLFLSLKVYCKNCNILTTLEMLEGHEAFCTNKNDSIDTTIKFEQIKVSGLRFIGFHMLRMNRSSCIH
jgi:hypothetical protein